MRLQRQPEKRAIGLPITDIIHLVRNLTTAPNPSFRMSALTELLTLIAVVPALIGLRRVWPRLWRWTMVGSVYLTGVLDGTPRYILTMFPVLLGLIAVSSWRARVVMVGASAGLLIINLFSFSLWYFVS